jgi:hypothetical protein
MTLAYVGQYKSWKISRLDADIASSATGREFLKVPVPNPYNTFVEVTGDGQGDFVLAAQRWTRPLRFGLPMPTRLYLVRVLGIGPGAAYEIQALPASWTAGGLAPEDGIALSPSGTRLAVSQGARKGEPPHVTIFGPFTHQATTWRLPAKMIDADPAFSGAPSWQGDSRHLAIDVSSGDSRRTRCLDCIRLLDTATKGGNFLADSKRLVSSSNLPAFVDWNTAFVTPDGSHVLRSAVVPIKVSPQASYDVPRIYDYSASTGRLLKTMTGPRSTDWAVMWTSPGGQSLIRSAVRKGLGNGFIKASVFTGGRWRPFRLPPQTRTAAW